MDLGAFEVLAEGPFSQSDPLVYYHLAVREPDRAEEWLAKARQADPAYCFPSRLEDLPVLAWAAERDVNDWLVRLLLGNLLAYLGRNDEALANWLTAADLNDKNGVLCRNMGLAYSLWRKDHAQALAWYAKAIANAPDEYHLHLERDRAMRAAEKTAQERLEALLQAPAAVLDRWELAALRADCLVESGRWEEALALMRSHNFRPWEGARGMHGLWVSALSGLAEQQRAAGAAAAALESYELALTYPRNLGVGRTCHAQEAKLHWLAAEVAGELGQGDKRQEHLRAAAEETHRDVCEADLYKQRALLALDRLEEAEKLAQELRLWSRQRLENHLQDALALAIRAEFGVEV
jgi:tetratricopeptide (TPR) repeat protein